MQRRAWLTRGGVAAAVVAGALVVWGAATGFGLREGSSGGEWLDYLSLQAMVADSDAVVVADLMFVETVGVEGELPDGDVLRIDRRLAAWRASTWLMGRASSGEVFYVETGDVPLNIGATHVLFLKERANTDGMAQWMLGGEPWFALVEPGGELRFIASERYREQHTDTGRTFPVEGSDAPFEATLEDVGRMVASLTTTPVATVSPECGPKPPKDAFSMMFVGGAMKLTWADCWADEDGLVVVAEFSGWGDGNGQFEYELPANSTEMELPAGDMPTSGCGSTEARLYVVRDGERTLAQNVRVIADCVEAN